MADREQKIERRYAVDAAALHPDLCEIPGNYFRACAAARDALKANLACHLGLGHDLYLLSNTTHGLVTVVAGLASDGILLDASSSPYSGYVSLVPIPQAATSGSTRLVTHIDPVSGAVADLSSRMQRPMVLDAAQSFGTIGHHAEVSRADIFICPLHKHVGIAPGLGLLGLKPDLFAPGLRAYAASAERGAAFLPLLQQALDQIERHNGNLINTLVFNVDEAFRSAIEGLGITLLTPDARDLPFVCLRGPMLGMHFDEFLTHGLSARQFDAENVVRISGAIRGTLASTPQDRTDDLLRAIRSAFARPSLGDI